MCNKPRAETGASVAGRDKKYSNAFDFYSQYLGYRDDPSALGTIQGPSWVDSPEIRGTSAILWLCMLTIIACVYTALHLNIPRKAGFWPVLAKKIRWVITALLVPEVMIYMSVHQFLHAQRLRRNLIERLRKLRENEDTGRNEGHQLPLESTIDLSLCFFIDMGGIKTRPTFTHVEWEEGKRHDEHNSSTVLEEQTPEYKLTPDGAYQLLCTRQWFSVTNDLIDDKSKANNFQKALVLLQVSWFAVQCVARKLYGLPLSLLEVHTVVHVVTAATMYLFWFRKPLDIRESEVWYDTTGVALEFHTHIWLLSSSVKSQLDSIYIRQANEPVGDDDMGNLNAKLQDIIKLKEPKVASHLKKLDTGHLEYIVSYIKEQYSGYIKPGQTPQSLKQIIEDIRGDKYNGAPIQRSRHNFVGGEDYFEGKLRRHEKRRSFIDAVKGLVSMLLRAGRGEEKRPFERYNILLTLLLPAIYGGIHLAAWNAAYPSTVEHVMWRVACIVIMTGIPGMTLIAGFAGLIFNLIETIEKKWYGRLAENILVSVFFCLIVAGTALLISARCFIVVESFVSLRTALIGVYWTPAWIQMLPHI